MTQSDDQQSLYAFIMMSYSVTALTARLLCKDNPHLIPLYEQLLEKTKDRLFAKASAEYEKLEELVSGLAESALGERLSGQNKVKAEDLKQGYTAVLDEIHQVIRKELGFLDT